MAEISLNVETREHVGTQAVKKLRAENKIPGIFYFHGSKNIAFTVDRAQLHSIWGHESSLLDVTFDGKKNEKCVIREIQFDPIKGTPIHIDLMGIEMTEKVKISVPVELIGEAVGVKNAGGVLQQIMREVEIECFPSDIPSSLELDISELEIGDNKHISDIEVENVEILEDSAKVVATVSAPRVLAEEEEEVAEEEEELEPEVLAQKAEEEEKEEE